MVSRTVLARLERRLGQEPVNYSGHAEMRREDDWLYSPCISRRAVVVKATQDRSKQMRGSIFWVLRAWDGFRGQETIIPEPWEAFLMSQQAAPFIVPMVAS